MVFSARNALDKGVRVGGSYNAGVWGWISRPLEASGGSGAPRRFFIVFFSKLCTHF